MKNVCEEAFGQYQMAVVSYGSTLTTTHTIDLNGLCVYTITVAAFIAPSLFAKAFDGEAPVHYWDVVAECSVRHLCYSTYIPIPTVSRVKPTNRLPTPFWYVDILHK